MNQAADAYCRAMLEHYENFTVASRLAPRPLRRDLARVYAFARTTDDLGDESGDSAAATRRLTLWRDEVSRMFAGDAPVHPVLVALKDTVARHSLDSRPFFDLIEANLQDQRVATYEDWPALLGYCRLSAAPVGRLVLRLFGVPDPRAVGLSDDVCIGLQLANFAQDVSVDAARGRTYLLQSDLREHGLAGAVHAMCERARSMLASGRELETMVSPRLRMQLALYRLGGEAILDAIARAKYATADVRPTVNDRARAQVAARALLHLLPGGREAPRGAAPASDVRQRRSGRGGVPAATGPGRPAAGTASAVPRRAPRGDRTRPVDAQRAVSAATGPGHSHTALDSDG